MVKTAMDFFIKNLLLVLLCLGFLKENPIFLRPTASLLPSFPSLPFLSLSRLRSCGGSGGLSRPPRALAAIRWPTLSSLLAFLLPSLSFLFWFSCFFIYMSVRAGPDPYRWQAVTGSDSELAVLVNMPLSQLNPLKVGMPYKRFLKVNLLFTHPRLVIHTCLL